MIDAAESVTAYMTNVGRAISRLINAVLGGYSGEMVSARVYRERRYFLINLVDGCFFWETKHCQGCYYTEMFDADRPIDYACQHHCQSSENPKQNEA